MYYKGLFIDHTQVNKPYTLNDVPESMLDSYTDTVPRKPGDSSLTYRQRIVDSLNKIRNKLASGVASHIHNLDKLELHTANFNANPGSNIFAKYDSTFDNVNYLRADLQSDAHGKRYGGPREFTTLDIETDDLGHPITVSALKQVYNAQTRKFETVGNFQRFYHANNRDLKESSAVHGLTSQKLKRLRSQQGYQVQADGSIRVPPHYSKTYNDDEAKALKEFFGSSVIVGHNIVDFDLPHLFHTPIGNSTIDTLTASRNQWSDRKNDLDSVFKRLFGKSMEEAGLSHHDSMSDVIATAMIAQKMMQLKGNTGDAIRYVAMHGGTHIAPMDTYLKSQVIKGSYNQYTNIERYINMKDYDGTEISIGDLTGSKQVFERDYDKDAQKPVLPSGMYYDDNNYDYDLISDMSLFSSSLQSAAKDIKAAAETNGAFVQEMTKVFSTTGFTDMRKFRLEAAKFDDPTEREAYIRAAGYGDNEVQDIMRGTSELNELLRKRRAKGVAERQYESSHSALQKAMWRAEREGNDWDLDTLREAMGKDPKSVWNALQDVEDSRKEMARQAKENEANVKAIQDLAKAQEQFEYDKNRKVNRALRHGQITGDQAEQLKLADSYDTLDDAMDETILKNQKLEAVLKSIASIPMYNFNRLEQVAKSEMGGIFSAARGIVPDFVLRPTQRLGSAFFNNLDTRLAGVRGITNTWSAVAPALGAAIGSVVPGIGTLTGAAIGGVIGGITQGYGNYREAQFTQMGEGIQNNLNTLGFLQEMILMPFRLLKQAISGLVKAFGLLAGAVTALRGIMINGLASLTQMGNPLSEMTGVNYGGYYGSKIADAASLLSAGTLNSAYEDFAKQQQQLYTTGKLDTNRLVAASMLGVFDKVYGPTDDWEGSFASMVNKLHSDMKSQSPSQKQQTMMLANTINPALGSVLQTMNTLGVDSYESLKRPTNIFMRSESAIAGWRPGWQKAQWEYQAVGSQWGVTKGRIATSLWNTAGRPVYNVFNRVMDSVANAMENGKWNNIIDIVKAGASELWSTVRQIFDIGDVKSLFGSIKDGLLDGATAVIELFRTKVMPKIFDVWDAISSYMIDKFTDLLSFLSTIRVDAKELLKLITTGKSDKPWITSLADVGVNKGSDAHFRSSPSFTVIKDVAAAFDAAHPGLPGFLASDGRIVQGIPYTKGKNGTTFTDNDYISWLTSRLQFASEEDIQSLNAELTKALGRDLQLSKSSNPVEVLNYILQGEEGNWAAANALHPQYKNITDTRNAPLNKAFHNIKEGSDAYRYIVDDVLLTGESMLQDAKSHSIIDINLKDDKDKKATLKVTDGHVSILSNNSDTDIIVQDGISQFFNKNATRMYGG